MVGESAHAGRANMSDRRQACKQHIIFIFIITIIVITISIFIIVIIVVSLTPGPRISEPRGFASLGRENYWLQTINLEQSIGKDQGFM